MALLPGRREEIDMSSSILWEILNFPNQGVDFKREIDSFQWGVGRGIASGEKAPPNITECVFTRKQDDSSPHIYREALYGNGRLMTFYFRTGTEKTTHTFMTVAMQNAMISSYSVGYGGDEPTESIVLNFKGVNYKVDPPPTK